MAIVIFIIILAILIIVHEYGHFIVAKKGGVRVDEFGLGYPPRAKKLWTKNGTDFTLNWLPFGGFVKIYGETPDSSMEESIGNSLNKKGVPLIAKPKWLQALVLFAGPFFNFAFAWLLILVTLFFGLPTSIDSSMDKNFVHDQKVVVVDVSPDSPASKAGVLAEDILKNVSIKGVDYSVIETETLHQLVESHPKDDFKLDILRDGKEINLSVKPEINPETKTLMLGIGISEFGIYKPTFLRAVSDSFLFTWSAIKSISVGLWGIISGLFSSGSDLSNVAGPVGIVSLVAKASKEGFLYILTFTALISINLGIINLIPFPALDGGRLLFLGIEKLAGRRVNSKILNTFNMVGFSLLIIFMLFITYKDIAKLL